MPTARKRKPPAKPAADRKPTAEVVEAADEPDVLQMPPVDEPLAFPSGGVLRIPPADPELAATRPRDPVVVPLELVAAEAFNASAQNRPKPRIDVTLNRRQANALRLLYGAALRNSLLLKSGEPLDTQCDVVRLILDLVADKIERHDAISQAA